MRRYTNDEITYLRLFVYGYGTTEFLEYFSLNMDKIENIIVSLQLKFKIRRFRRIIQLAFEQKILSPEDFVEDSIKKITSEHAFRISQGIKGTNTGHWKEKLQESISDYLQSCNHELEFNRSINRLKKNNMNLTAKEKALIELIYIGIVEDRKIERILEISSDRVLELKRNILKVLGANSWHNAIRRAFQLNLLDKRKYSELDLDKEIGKCADRIMAIKLDGNEDKNELEIQLLLYEEILDLYNTYEYSYLLRRDFKEYRDLYYKMEINTPTIGEV